MEEDPLELPQTTVWAAVRDLPGGEQISIQPYADGISYERWKADSFELLESAEWSYDEYEAYRQRNPQLKLPELDFGPRPLTGGYSGKGNTVGRIVGETAPSDVSANDANPEVAAETEEESDTGSKILDGIQIGLDVAGLVPGFGEIADGVNGLISLARGDYAGAALSFAAMIPFVGWGATAGKAAKRGNDALGTAKGAGKEVGKKASKETSEKATKESSEKAGKSADGKGEGGGKSKKNSNAEKGKCGERLAKRDMEEEGFEVISVQNKSGHGVDLIGRNSKGQVKVWEVKTTDTAKAGSLSKAQRELGGKDFTDSRLTRAAEGIGNYGKYPDVMDNAKKALDWIDKAGDNVIYEKYEVFVDDLEKGCSKHPTRKSKPKPWEKKGGPTKKG